MGHLTPAQVTAYRDGELRDPAAERHLASCRRCRDRLAEARRIAALIRSAREAHPDAETLAAYFDDVLSPEETAQVKRHLGHCRRCAEDLALLGRF